MESTMMSERCAVPAANDEPAILGETAQSHERVQEGVLVRRILAGESDLFAKLMQPCGRQIKAVALRALGNRPEVDDIAQETALKAFMSLDRFRQDARFQTWVTSIAVNEVRQFLRSSRSHRLESLDTTYADSQSESWRKIDLIQTSERPATECVFRGQVNELLGKALRRLPERLRTIVILRDLEELSLRQTADRLHLSIAAVKSRHFRARRTLQRLVRPYRGVLFVKTAAQGTKRTRPASMSTKRAA
jgi:RNA polymerase sigma-70 factor (ECF subfamily)